MTQNGQSKILFNRGNINYSLGRSKQSRGVGLGAAKGYNYYYNANF